jgi:hypothetical protein
VLPDLADVPFDQNAAGQTAGDKTGGQQGENADKKKTK